jgi:hypothetical protein
LQVPDDSPSRNSDLRPGDVTTATETSVKRSWRIPLALGVAYGLAALLLVLVELAAPGQSDDFKGIKFSNTVGSAGSRQILAMYRDHLEWLPRPYKDATLSPDAYIGGLIIAWAAMFVAQFVAVWACRRGRLASAGWWLAGPLLACAIFLFYPPTSTDIFAYGSFGWVADESANPYLISPKELGGDPYAGFNDWTHIRSPYGPIWTGISHAIVHFAQDEPFATAIGFKLAATLPAIGLAIMSYHLAKRFTTDERLTRVVLILVGWSPILITESAATVHLDSLMMALAIMGLMVATSLTRRSHRIGVALVVASALVKPVTLPLIALLMIVRVATPDRPALVARRILGDLLVMAAMVAVLFAPFWERDLPGALYDNARTLYLDHPLRANPLWVWGLRNIDRATGFSDLVGGSAKGATSWITLTLMILAAAFVLRALWRQRQASAMMSPPEIVQASLRFSVWSWAAVTVIVGILPVNAHPWYAIWPLTMLSLLWITDLRRDRLRPPLWLVVLQGWIVVSFLIYHTLPKR